MHGLQQAAKPSIEKRSRRPHVAETPEQAEAAARLVRVEYEDLPVLADPLEALKPGAPQLYADVDREKCLKHGVALADVFATLQADRKSTRLNSSHRT